LGNEGSDERIQKRLFGGNEHGWGEKNIKGSNRLARNPSPAIGRHLGEETGVKFKAVLQKTIPGLIPEGGV